MEERQEFERQHALPEWTPYQPEKGEIVRAYLGIDSGSTTTKFVLMDEREEILDSFYASNKGAPLAVAKEALLNMKRRYEKAGASLEILGVGTTGYGEQLFANAFSQSAMWWKRWLMPGRGQICAGRFLYPGYRRTGYESDLAEGRDHYQHRGE